MARLILSLPELSLRVSWLGDYFQRWPSQELAHRLEALCAQSERCEPRARQAMLPVACYFAEHGDSALVRELGRLADEQHLLSLQRMLYRGPTSSIRPPRLQDVPDYGTGRELTVGERRSLARRPVRGYIEKLSCDPHPLVLHTLLLNPYLVEADVLRLAARRPAHVAALECLARCPQWLCRARVRLAMLQNPGTPPSIAAPLLVVCNRHELSQVVSNAGAPGFLRATARELLGMRPPLKPAGAGTSVLQ